MIKEPSTWGGIGVIVAGVERFVAQPVTVQSWMMLGGSVAAGLAAVFLRERGGVGAAGAAGTNVTVTQVQGVVK